MLLLDFNHGNGDTGVIAVSENKDLLVELAMTTLKDELDQVGEDIEDSLCDVVDEDGAWSIMYNGDCDSALSYRVRPVDVL